MDEGDFALQSVRAVELLRAWRQAHIQLSSCLLPYKCRGRERKGMFLGICRRAVSGRIRARSVDAACALARPFWSRLSGHVHCLRVGVNVLGAGVDMCLRAAIYSTRGLS
jgi:hypothetical protein